MAVSFSVFTVVYVTAIKKLVNFTGVPHEEDEEDDEFDIGDIEISFDDDEDED